MGIAEQRAADAVSRYRAWIVAYLRDGECEAEYALVKASHLAWAGLSRDEAKLAFEMMRRRA